MWVGVHAYAYAFVRVYMCVCVCHVSYHEQSRLLSSCSSFASFPELLDTTMYTD